MTYTKETLPKTFLTPPIDPDHPFAVRHWERNWSLYFISRQWSGPKRGMLTTLARWVKTITPDDDEISRQRVQDAIQAMSWRTRDHSDAELGIDPVSSRGKIEE